jgi:hypothetical protein
MAQLDLVIPDRQCVTRGIIAGIADPGGPRGTKANLPSTSQRFGNEQRPLPCTNLSAPGGESASEIRR